MDMDGYIWMDMDEELNVKNMHGMGPPEPSLV